MRYPVTREQLSGSRWQNRRVEKAMVRRDTRDIPTPLRNHSMAMWMGVASMVLMCVGGFIVAKISPQSSQRDSKFVVAASGGRFVQYGEEFHPVLNLASARLILGTPEEAKPVKDSVLATRAAGQKMGIYGGPEMLDPRDDDTARWTVCDTKSSQTSLTKSAQVRTTLVAGVDNLADQRALSEPNAVLVKDPDTIGQVWILWGHRRATVAPTDKASLSVLGLTPDRAGKAAPISRGLLDAIDPAPPITAPFIPSRGEASAAVPGRRAGDIVRAKNTRGDDVFTVVYQDGVQEVPALVAELLAATGSQVDTGSTAQLSAAPRVHHVDVDAFPPEVPVYVQAPVLCWSWSRGAADAAASTRLTLSDRLPIPVEDSVKNVPLLPATGIEQAQQAFTAPGKGWYARVTGDAVNSEAREQLLWIDDAGVRYFIGLENNSYDGTVKALGINKKPPLLIPWSIAKLYAQGPTLSKTAALTLHASAPTDQQQRAAPSTTGPDGRGGGE